MSFEWLPGGFYGFWCLPRWCR